MEDLNQPIPHSTFRKGLKHSSAIATCSGIKGILTFLPPILIAKRLGLGNITDAYFMATAINLIISKFLRLGTLNKMFVMTFSEDFVKSRKKTEENLNISLNIIIVLSGLLMVVIYFAIPLLVGLIARGFPVDKRLLTVSIMRLMVPLFFYQLIIALFGCIFKLSNQFAHWAFLDLITPLVAAYMVYGHLSQFGIYSIVYGMLLGAFIHLLLLIYFIYFRFNYSYRFKLDFKHRVIREVPRLLYPYYLSSIFVQIVYLVQSFLVSLLAPGLASAFFLALRMQKYVEIYVLDSLSQFSFIYFIKKIAGSSLSQLKNAYQQLLHLTNYAFCCILILLAINGPRIIETLFGSRFTDPGIVTKLSVGFSCFMLFLMPEATNRVQFAVILSMKKTMCVNLVNISRMIIVILLSLILFPRFGFWGVVFAHGLTHLQGAIIGQWYLRKWHQFESFFFKPCFLKIIFLNLLLLIFSLSLYFIIQRSFILAGSAHKIAASAISFFLGISFYLLISYLFKSKELHTLVSIVRKR